MRAILLMSGVESCVAVTICSSIGCRRDLLQCSYLCLWDACLKAEKRSTRTAATQLSDRQTGTLTTCELFLGCRHIAGKGLNGRRLWKFYMECVSSNLKFRCQLELQPFPTQDSNSKCRTAMVNLTKRWQSIRKLRHCTPNIISDSDAPLGLLLVGHILGNATIGCGFKYNVWSFLSSACKCIVLLGVVMQG